jgi:hypothetical protein
MENSTNMLSNGFAAASSFLACAVVRIFEVYDENNQTTPISDRGNRAAGAVHLGALGRSEPA